MCPEAREICVIVRIDLDADPITGSLTTADGALRRFSGWIALAAALEAVREARTQDTEAR
jgi:hypothetical protein